jgi:putative peptide zinc metalloprotease protein
VTIATPAAPYRPAPTDPPSPARHANGDCPQRAAGLELIGRFEGSGFKDPPYLARRSDGQVIQLSRLLFLVAEAADGRNSPEAIAARVGRCIGRRVSADNVCFLVERKLRPLGVLAGVDGSTPELAKRPPLLALRHRRPLLRERAVRALALPFAPLFVPPVVAIVLAALAALDTWLFGFHGVAAGMRTALYQPTLLLGLVVAVIAATAFHEIGHAAACRYGGARPGAIGAGLYLVWPAFYCDVTDAYRLNRRGRLRTDLGGIYFNGIFCLLAAGAYFATGEETLLLLVVVQHLTMLQQLLPLLRFDGYYVLTDLTGVPDILSRIGPILRGLVPFRPTEPTVRELKPWVRAVVTVYIALLVPVLTLMLTWMVMGAPRVMATAFDSLGLHAARLAQAFGRGEWSLTALAALQIIALVLQCAGMGLVLGRTGRSTGRRLRRWSNGSARRKTVAIAGSLAVAAAVAAQWWPNGEYEPLRPGERGTIPEAVSGLPDLSSGRPAFSPERASQFGRVATVAQTKRLTLGSSASPPSESPTPPGQSPMDGGSRTRPGGDPAPGAGDPRPVPPNGSDGTATQAPPPSTGGTSPADPANPPDPPATPQPTPGPGTDRDNTAEAVNRDDGALVLRLAFDLQFIVGGEVDQSNAAIAHASCDGCRTIAIAIQLLIATGDLEAIDPTNVAVALNEACTSCETLAYAYQLVFATPERLRLTTEGRTQLAAILAAVWLAASSDVPIQELRAQLDGLMLELREVMATELVPAAAPEASTPQTTATPAPERTATPTSEQPPTPASEEPPTPASEQTATPTPDPTSAPTPDPTSAPIATPTMTPSATPTPTPTPMETPSPAPTATPTPTP